MVAYVCVIAGFLALQAPARSQTAGPSGHAPSFGNLSHQAEAARDANRLEESLDLYKRALDLKPNWEDGWWSAGSIAYDLNRYAECSYAFTRMVQLKPDSAPAWTMEGICQYNLRDFKAALGSLTRAEALRFEETPELSRAGGLHLALVLNKFGYFEKALLLLTDVTAIEQKAPEVIAAAGIAGLRKQWIPPEVPPSERDKVFKLGDAMATALLRDNNGPALEKFELALHDYPKEPEIHYRFGAFLMKQDPERGIREIKEALALEPDHLPALMSLAKIYLRRNEAQAALTYAAQAVKLSREDVDTHVALGQALLGTGDAAGAARELELAVKLSPNDSGIHYNLSTAYSKLGRKDDAAREREESRRLHASPPVISK